MNDEAILDSILEAEYEPDLTDIKTLNVAVIGKTGSGKSSFLNAFRNIKNTHRDAARVGAGVNPTLVDREKFIVDAGINLYDLKGFFDNQGTNVEEELNKVRYADKVNFIWLTK